MMKQIPLIFFIILLLLAIAGPLFISANATQFNLEQSFLSPSSQHWMGTDENGRDILARVISGSRVSLGIGLSVVAISSLLGILLGTAAAFFGGIWEKGFLAVADVFQAFPGILLAIVIAAFLPPSVFNLITLLSILGWVGYARMARMQVLSLVQKEFIEATRALGLPFWRVGLFHLLPNMAGPLLVQATFGLAGVILTESTLSFLGLGVPVSTPSWGRMLDTGSQFLLVAPHLSVFPGLAIMLTIMTFNLLGDRLRDRVTGHSN